MYGQHYSSAIARLFRPCGKGKNLYFEGRRYGFHQTPLQISIVKIERVLASFSQYKSTQCPFMGVCYFRAYIEFERPQNSNSVILQAVYLALKMR